LTGYKTPAQRLNATLVIKQARYCASHERHHRRHVTPLKEENFTGVASRDNEHPWETHVLFKEVNGNPRAQLMVPRSTIESVELV